MVGIDTFDVTSDAVSFIRQFHLTYPMLRDPGSHGFSITAWLVPVVVVLGAALAIAGVVVLGRRRGMAHNAAVAGPPVTASEDARLDATLTAFGARR